MKKGFKPSTDNILGFKVSAKVHVLRHIKGKLNLAHGSKISIIVVHINNKDKALEEFMF